MAIKYTIPSLTPSATDLLASFCREALHMAHCAFPSSKKKQVKSKK
jgi:hypothetical protein